MNAKNKGFFRDFWRLLTPYWKSEERWKSGALLVAVIGLNLASVYINVSFNHWNNDFFNTLQNKDLPGFYHYIWVFVYSIGTPSIIVTVYALYFQQMLQIRWRRWMTEDTTNKWLKHNSYYRLQMKNGKTDNPDQRISEDINKFVTQTLYICLSLMNSTVSVFSFSYVLWDLSRAITVFGMIIPGYMLWVAALYALVGSWLMHVIGRPLIGLNFQQQKYEANFRFSLVRIRENTEGIALYNGEAVENRKLQISFGDIIKNWWDIMRRQKKLTWFSDGYSQIASIFPYLVVGPRFFVGAITLGGLQQTVGAFGEVQNALSWFINQYYGDPSQSNLTEWKATIDRLTSFQKALDATVAAQPTDALHSVSEKAGALVLKGVDISLPDGRPLINNLNLTLAPGSRTLITGPSGVGKSTLFRLIGGLWPYWRGSASVPDRDISLFLPQKPYLPIATLKTTAAYPRPAEDFTDAEVIEALQAVGLPDLALRLNDEQHWTQVLSPGEQQRLAFARAFLLKPRWLFMDEATSALDDAAETLLYSRLIERLPETALVSIAHRPGVTAFHENRPVFNWMKPALEQDAAE